MNIDMPIKKQNKVKNFIKENKVNIYIFLAMLIFTIIICSNFFNMHFSQDTYSLYSSGWDAYIKHFLLSNRIFSALELWISKVFNISFEMTILISSIVSMIVFSLTWFILYKFIVKMIKKEHDKWQNLLIIGITFSIIFNFCTFETMVFAEVSIMSISILLAVIAACLYTEQKYIKSFITLMISTFCYQTAASLFLVLTLVFIAYKHKGNIKEIVKKSIGVFFFWGITMILNLVMTKLFSSYFGMTTRRTTILSIDQIISTIVHYGKYLLLENLEIGPKGWYLIFIVILSVIFIVSIIKDKKYFHIFEYIVLVLLSFIVPTLPLIVMPIESQYIEARMAMCFGAILGVILLYLVIVMKAIEIKGLNKLIYILTACIFMINAIYFIRASSENMATVYLDRNLAKSVLQAINKYEETTGNTVDTIGITWDKNPTTYYDGQLKLRSTNARGMVTDFSVIQALEYSGGKSYNAIYQVPDNVKSYFEQYDWEFFSEEQLLFEDNNLWLCLY